MSNIEIIPCILLIYFKDCITPFRYEVEGGFPEMTNEYLAVPINRGTRRYYPIHTIDFIEITNK